MPEELGDLWEIYAYNLDEWGYVGEGMGAVKIVYFTEWNVGATRDIPCLICGASASDGDDVKVRQVTICYHTTPHYYPPTIASLQMRMCTSHCNEESLATYLGSHSGGIQIDASGLGTTYAKLDNHTICNACGGKGGAPCEHRD